jgi:hypothetical protein
MRVRIVLLFLLFAAAACGPDSVGPGSERPPTPDDTVRFDPGDTLFSTVTAGLAHACALTRGGRVFCWGANLEGALGVPFGNVSAGSCAGATACSFSRSPLLLRTPIRLAAISTAYTRSCGPTPSGVPYCWGYPTRPGFAWVSDGDRFVAVAQANLAVCFLTADGRASCHYEAGIESGPNAPGAPGPETILPISPTLRFTSIGATCGTTADGAVYCWQRGIDPLVFDTTGVRVRTCYVGRTGTYPCTPDPMRLRTTVRFERASSQTSNCAIAVGGVPYCWLTSERVLLPDTAPYQARPLPAPVPARTFFSVGTIACIHAVDGRVLCRGDVGAGLLGNGVVKQAAPDWTEAAGGLRFVSVAATTGSLCGVTADGALYCWGRDDEGQLGTGTTAPPCPSGLPGETFPCRATPARIASVAGIR